MDNNYFVRLKERLHSEHTTKEDREAIRKELEKHGMLPIDDEPKTNKSDER